MYVLRGHVGTLYSVLWWGQNKLQICHTSILSVFFLLGIFRIFPVSYLKSTLLVRVTLCVIEHQKLFFLPSCIHANNPLSILPFTLPSLDDTLFSIFMRSTFKFFMCVNLQCLHLFCGFVVGGTCVLQLYMLGSEDNL